MLKKRLHISNSLLSASSVFYYLFGQNWVLCYTIYFSSKDGAKNHLMVCFFPESFSFMGSNILHSSP
jgi:hypothetical protein